MQTTELLRVLHLVKEGKALLLDIRSPEEYCAAHLPGAILIPTPHPPLSPAQQDTRTRITMCLEAKCQARKKYSDFCVL